MVKSCIQTAWAFTVGAVLEVLSKIVTFIVMFMMYGDIYLFDRIKRFKETIWAYTGEPILRKIKYISDLVPFVRSGEVAFPSSLKVN